jgi:hypothetical protein
VVCSSCTSEHVVHGHDAEELFLRVDHGHERGFSESVARSEGARTLRTALPEALATLGCEVREGMSPGRARAHSLAEFEAAEPIEQGPLVAH